MALARDPEGLVPPEGCPFHGEAHAGKAGLECPERPDGRIRLRELAAQVGVRVDHDGLCRELVGNETDLGQRLFYYPFEVVLIDGLDSTKDRKGILRPVLEQGRLLGNTGLLFRLVFNKIGMYQKEPNASSQVYRHSYPHYVCIHRVYILQDRGFS